MNNLILKKNVLIFSDLDGTALNENHIFDEDMIETVKKVYDRNFYFIPVTARVTDDALRQGAILGIDKFSGYVSANNGAQIYSYKKNRFIRDSRLDDDFIKFTFENTYGKIGEYKAHFFGDNTTYVYGYGDNTHYWTRVMNAEYKIISSLEEIEGPINRLCIILEKNPTKNNIKKFKDLFSKYRRKYAVVTYSDRVHEFMPKNCTKGSVINYVIKDLGLKRSETSVISFGDSFNDIPMFELSDYSVAMENAEQTIKGYADYITRSNDNKGVSHFIKYSILSEK